MSTKNKKLPNPVNYSLWLLNYKPRSVKEMTLALKKRGFSEEVAAETVESLKRWGYIDDDRYKEYLVEKRKRNNPKGRNFVRRELQEAGIDCEYELEDLYADEEEREIIGKLLSQWCERGKDFEENKNRYFQRLYRRGFSTGNISDQIRLFEEISEKDCE
ncbi:MAG: regulatory protein RecX [Clostridia bacterium]